MSVFFAAFEPLIKMIAIFSSSTKIYPELSTISQQCKIMAFFLINFGQNILVLTGICLKN